MWHGAARRRAQRPGRARRATGCGRRRRRARAGGRRSRLPSAATRPARSGSGRRGSPTPCGREAPSRRTAARRPAPPGLPADEPERRRHRLRRPRRRARPGVPPRVVPRAASDAPERCDRLRQGRPRQAVHGSDADRGRPLRAPDRLLPQRPEDPPHAGGDREGRDADAGRPLLREPAAARLRPVGAVRAGGDRDQRLLARPHRLDAGRPDRHPRDERPSSIGTAASYGCLRIANRLARRMLYANPEGTPVVIRA